MHRAKAGWHRRLHVTPYLRVGDQTIAHVSLLHLQSVYDGASELEQEWWTVEISAGEHILFARLRQVLAFFEPARLREAIAADPVGFAELVAIAHGLVRIGVVAPGRVVSEVLVEHGREPLGPTFVQDVLSFQYYAGLARKLWSIRASSAGKILKKKLLRSFGK